MRNQVSSNLNKRNDFRRSGKLRGHGGFTLAELLIVIAIILILAGFGFVSVIQNQRRLRLREMDDIARQIFIAAQNHLTVAEASGQWDYEKLAVGSKDDIEKRLGLHNDLYTSYEKIKDAPEKPGTEIMHDYRVITSNLGLANGSAIDTILPFGAIDETLKGRRFIILYDAKTATINGVYYSEYDGDLNFENVTQNIYAPYIYNNGPIDDRRGRLASAATRLIGWYGPGEADGVDDSGLYRPIVTVENAENLVLKIVDKNIKNPTVIAGTDTTSGAKTEVKITYKGLSSKAEVTQKIHSQGHKSNDPNNSDFMKLNPSDSRFDAIWSANKGSITNPSDPEHPDYVWNYNVYLDSVTVNKGHFADIFTDFIPGEDIEISVSIVYDNGGSSKESKAAVVKTNSLFGSLSSSDNDRTVTVANGRHLQNLSYDISHVGYFSKNTDEKDADLTINKASIIYGVTWNEDRNHEVFVNKIIASDYYSGTDNEVNVYNYSNSGSESPQGDNKFSAIRNKDLTEINGNMNELVNFDIVGSPDSKGTPSGSAGLIGKVEANDFTVSNLILINPEVTSTSNAGAFVGNYAPEDTSKKLTITSCAAYNAAYHADEGLDNGDWNDFANSKQDLTITSSGGSAGGLVGSMTAGTITNSVASLYVNAPGSKGNAGGLVGTSTGTVNITDSYAGGHTAGSATSDIDLIGYYQGVTTGTERGRYNIISAGGAAGGLIGSYAGGTISHCYSTASASGTSAAGGLIGTATNPVTATNSYCTGRVGGSTDTIKGQFIGTGALATGSTGSTGNHYFSIVNNDMKAIGGADADPAAEVLAALDADLTTYNNFVNIGKTDETGVSVAADAKPYDGGLTKLYEGKYALKTISQLGGPSPDTIPEWLTTHYGDWPAPETLVVNVPAGS